MASEYWDVDHTKDQDSTVSESSRLKLTIAFTTPSLAAIVYAGADGT